MGLLSMGKKSATEATDLFEGLDTADVKASEKDELGKTVTRGPQTQTMEATATRPPGINPKRSSAKKGFEDIDPMLEKMLVHPEATGVIERSEISRTEGSNLNLVKGDKSVAAPLSPDPVESSLPVQDDLSLERDSDKTQRIQIAKPVASLPDHTSKMSSFSSAPVSGSGLEEQLRSANYLELAQNRVLELEKEVQKLRRDNEQLSSAGQHFKELTETIKQQLKQSEANFFNLKEIAEEEKKILTQSLEAKEIKIGALQERLIELEEKINSSFDHVRIRERELENRLEIMKTESEAVMSSKDEMILDLKKQLNLVNSDLEKYRIQNQKITSKVEGKEELLRRTVKALRIALTMLEGSRPDEDN